MTKSVLGRCSAWRNIEMRRAAFPGAVGRYFCVVSGLLAAPNSVTLGSSLKLSSLAEFCMKASRRTEQFASN